jgi:hypothetical protein
MVKVQGCSKRNLEFAMTRNISMVLPDGKNIISLEANSPLSNIIGILSLQGFTFVKITENHDYLICFNYQADVIRATSARRENRILVVMEPKVTSPSSHKARNRMKFGKTIVFSPKWDMGNDVVLPWPQKELTDRVKLGIERKKKVCQIVSNKFSFVKGQQYGLRRKIILDLSHKVDTYGMGWDDKFTKKMIRLLSAFLRGFWDSYFRSLFEYLATYKSDDIVIGAVDNKIDVMSRYEIALVIENSLDYVSEKLIDAIFAGTCPLYVGPNIDEFGFPKRIAYECAPSVDKVNEAIDVLMRQPEMLESIKREGLAFIESIQFKKFENRAVFTALAYAVIGEFSGK